MFTHERLFEPPELFLATHQRPTRLTDTTPREFREVAWIEPERITVPAADGTPVRAHVFASLPMTERMPTDSPFGITGDPNTDVVAARHVHTQAVAGIVYSNSLMREVGKLLGGMDAHQSATLYAADLIDRMKPRDPAEEMLVVQMVLAHVRVLHLTNLATKQTQVKQLEVLNGYADKASNTYRRLMMAIHEYRRPPKSSLAVTSIGQTNIAGQQVVLHGDSERNATNEQGSQRGGAAASLPPDSPGHGVTASCSPPHPPLDPVDRTAIGRG